MSAVVPEESLKKPDNIETQEANDDGGNSKEKTNDNTQSVKNEDDFKTPNSEDVDKEKKRKNQRRLSFADEHGQDLKEVSYHSNLHYSQGEGDQEQSKNNSGGCCVIS